MAIQSKTETIDGLEFTTTQLPAMDSFNLLAKLTKLLAPILEGADGLSLDSELSELAPLLGGALSQLEDGGASKLALEVLGNTSVIVNDAIVGLNTAEKINAVFGGRLLTMLKAMGFALKVNYADFFDSALVQKASAEAAKASDSTLTTTS